MLRIVSRELGSSSIARVSGRAGSAAAAAAIQRLGAGGGSARSAAAISASIVGLKPTHFARWFPAGSITTIVGKFATPKALVTVMSGSSATAFIGCRRRKPRTTAAGSPTSTETTVDLGVQAGEALDERDRLLARLAPGRPEVEEHDPPAQRGERSAAAVEGRQRHRRRRDDRDLPQPRRNEELEEREEHDERPPERRRPGRASGERQASPQRFAPGATRILRSMPSTRAASVTIDARALPATNRSHRIFEAFDKLPRRRRSSN